jgi:hypothetical protein
MTKQSLIGRADGKKAYGTVNGQKKYTTMLKNSHASFLNNTNNENAENTEYRTGFMLGYQNAAAASSNHTRRQSRSRSRSRSRSQSHSSNAATAKPVKAKSPSPVMGLVPPKINTTFKNGLHDPKVSHNMKIQQKFLSALYNLSIGRKPKKG